jgi:hypothetical protein
MLPFPFALGQDQEQSPRELPLGPLREAINVRQRRGGAFSQRSDYLAASMVEFDGTLTPFDLYNLNGRLFALGNRQTLFAGGSAPTDLFEYVEQAGGAWKGTLPVGGTGTRVPPITKLRNMGQVPDAVSGVQTARVAARGGLVCLVYGFGQPTGGSTSYVHIFRASTDSTILFQPVSAANLRAVVAGNSFWVLGVNSASDLIGFRFDTTVDDDLQAPVTLYTGTVTGSIFDAVSVAAASIAQFAVFIRDGSTTVIRRFNEAGTQQTTFAGPAVAPDILVIEADSVANQIMVATRVGAADVFLSTYNLTTNALLAGPTAMFGEAVTGDLSIVRANLGGTVGDLFTEDDTARVLWSRFITVNHLGNIVTPAHNFIMGGQGVQSPLATILPVISGDNSNQLLLFDLQSGTVLMTGAQVDEHIANPLVGAVGKGGTCCRDAQTGLFYWGRIIEGTDGQAIPLVGEFAVADTGRRQACQIGNLLFMAGGVALSFDGRQLAENVFLERPVFQSSTPGTLGGLIPNAEYDYVAVFKWTDGQGRLAQSQVSQIVTITLGPTQDSVQHLIYAPHTMRKDANTGSVPFISLYRTDAVALTTPATALGANVVDPPSASLNGQTLQFFVTDSLGTDPFVVTFGPGATNPTAIAAAINAVSTGRLTATNDAGRIRLTVDEEGSVALLQIFGTTGATILGFAANTTAAGTTTLTKGTVFRLAASAIVPLADQFGAPVLLSDTTTDTDILTHEPLYTQGERGGITGILEHEAAPACQFCAAVGARVFVGGLADRSQVAISKELAPAEGLAFSNDFSFRANVDGDVTAVGGLDGVPVAFTADAIYRFSAELPDDSASEGELGEPFRIPSEEGCRNENSVLETSFGLFYQAPSGKLMVLPRGGGAPEWIGQRVQDTLALFPVVIGAAMITEEHCAVFLCRNTAATASIILVFDLRIGQWYQDTFASAQNHRAAVDYLGRLAYIDGSIVRLQSTLLVPASFIPFSAKTGSLVPFAGEDGRFIGVTVHGTYHGPVQVRARVSYDDGITFTNLKTFTLTNAEFSDGVSITLQWWPSIRKTDSFVLDFQELTNGSASAGVDLNHYTLEVAELRPRRAKTSTAQRG